MTEMFLHNELYQRVLACETEARLDSERNTQCTKAFLFLPWMITVATATEKRQQ